MHKAKLLLTRFAISFLLAVGPIQGLKLVHAGDLAKEFASPPATAKPWVYWFWSDGNMTKEGATADLEAMKRVGIGGVLIMEVDQGIPSGPVRFMSSQWREFFRFVLAEANRLGIEISMNNDGGWTGSGGPWVKPEHAMQMLVWSEKHVQGPAKIEQALIQPHTVEGYYSDIAVLAFPTPASESPRMADAKGKLTCVSQGFDGTTLLDGTLGTGTRIHNADTSEPVNVQIDFEHPFTATALVLGCSEWYPPWVKQLYAMIEVSDNGSDYRPIKKFHADWPVSYVNFDKVTARHYRLAFTGVTSTVAITEVELLGSPRIPDIAGRAGYLRQEGLGAIGGITVSPEVAISRGGVRDISKHMNRDGRLSWDAPEGKWTILRIGHTPTGRKNAPAPKESIGNECDKLSREAVEVHFNGFIAKLAEDQKAMGGEALKHMHIDSWEVGSQNWTARFGEEFRKRRGYDPLPFLPVVTGRFVDSPEVTERFLWDFRRTIGDLVADYYAGHMKKLAHKHGLDLSIEAYGSCVFDNLTFAGRCDIPMSEFWTGNSNLSTSKAMSSAAHTYGHPIVQAEAFTAMRDAGKWQNHPKTLKALGDQAFCAGVNRFVFHRYAMQPWVDRKPGMTMGRWGIHFERTNTWWDNSPAWLQYLARCQHIHQNGRFVADIAYLYGETAPNKLLPREKLQPQIPKGYDYDGCTPEVVLTRMSVKDGRLVLPDGMSYRVLILAPGDTMTPVLLTKIKELVEAGATIVGSRPVRSPSLADYPACDEQVCKLADALWGDCDGKNILEHRVGKGRIVWGLPLDRLFAEMGVQPDFSTRTDLEYIHRVIADTDLYFVANPLPYPVQVACTFRTSGKYPELWHPESGRIERAVMYAPKDGGTCVLLTLPSNGSVFVVFRQKNDSADSVVAVARNGKTIANLATGKSSSIDVTEASYGVLDDPARTRDVREEVQQRVDQGEQRFLVAELAKSGDPAPNVVKTLVIECTIDGKPATLRGFNGDIIPLNIPAPYDRVLDVLAADDGSTRIEAWESGRYEITRTSGRKAQIDVPNELTAVEVAGPWEVRFPVGWGAPEHITLDKLIAWNKYPKKGVKYFSGTATYYKTINVSAEMLGKDRRLYLDLGGVCVMADVKLNGKALGLLWKEPFIIDITDAVRSGDNSLEVEVTNMWPNRLIGDEQLPDDCERKGQQIKAWPQWLLEGKQSPTGRITFATWKHYDKNSVLQESGLIGPVRIQTTYMRDVGP